MELIEILAIRTWLKDLQAQNNKDLEAFSDGFKYAVKIGAYDNYSVSHFTNTVCATELAQQYNNGWADIYTNNPNFISAAIDGHIYYVEEPDKVTRLEHAHNRKEVYNGDPCAQTMDDDTPEAEQDDTHIYPDAEEYYADIDKQEDERENLKEEIKALDSIIGQFSVKNEHLTRTRDRLIHLLRAITVFIMICVMLGCSDSKSGNRQPTVKTVDTSVQRILILEQGTTSYVKLSTDDRKVLRFNDTVWVDLASHTLSDTAKDAMLCVMQVNTQ